MSQATHVYRNKRNGKVGTMTEEQAAIWPELLVQVEDGAKPLAYMRTPDEVINKGDDEPPADSAPAATDSAPTDKKKD